MNDWILWQKGILIAARLRNNPSLVPLALERHQNRKKPLFSANYEWLELLQSKDIEAIASILDSSDHESQRLRSSSPFVREPFIEGNETEAIHARAHLGRLATCWSNNQELRSGPILGVCTWIGSCFRFVSRLGSSLAMLDRCGSVGMTR